MAEFQEDENYPLLILCNPFSDLALKPYHYIVFKGFQTALGFNYLTVCLKSCKAGLIIYKFEKTKVQM